MSNLIVHGGTPLRGRVVPSANKNAVLPILCATLLTDQPLRLNGVPDITDVRKILDIFRALGSQVKLDETTRVLDLHHRDTRFDAAVHRLPGNALVHHAGAAAAGALRRGAAGG